MAGLLDFLSTDDAQLGLGLLAAGGPSTTPMDFGQRIAAGVAQAQAAKDGRLRNKLLESQIAENTSQDMLRRAQLERQARQDAYYLGGNFAAPGTGATSAAGASGTPASAGGTPASAGAALKAAAGAPADAPPPSQGKFAEWSKQYGIPVDALVADYFSNGGKSIADMLFKRGTPDMQVQNGYVYDKNRVQPGFLPSLNTSQDGKSTLTLIDPATGLPNVMPTPGAVGAFGAFQEAGNRSAANYQPETVIDPATGQKVVRPRSEVLQPRSPAPVLPGRPLGAGPGYAGGSAAAAAGGQAEILNAELQRATQELAAAQQRGDAAGAARAQQDVAGIQRELQRLPGGARTAPLIGPGAGAQPAPAAPAATVGNVVELSPQQQAENEANRARLVDTAKADVVRDTGRAADTKKSAQMQSVAQQAMQLLDAGPTASGAGALLDSALNFVGQPSRSGSAAQQLEALSGWMVANVPRMEGPQSDADVRNYAAMAGRVGDRTLPIEARKAALRTVIELQNKYAALNGGTAPSAPAPAASPAAGGLPPGWTVKVR